jgi:hypothetical protein
MRLCRACGATPFRLPIPISNFGGVYWTKFECISVKIRRILTNNLCASQNREAVPRAFAAANDSRANLSVLNSFQGTIAT